MMGWRDTTNAWILKVEQFMIAHNLPKGNEPNVNCNDTTITGNAVNSETTPGISWQTLILRRRPEQDVDASAVRVDPINDGYELINATIQGQELVRMSGRIGRLNAAFDRRINDCLR